VKFPAFDGEFLFMKLSACILLILTSLTLAAEPSAVDWMPRVEDQTGLWWVNGPPQMFQRAERTKEEILGFQFGKQTMLFDTRRVRPVEGEWECAVIVEGRRLFATGTRSRRTSGSSRCALWRAGAFFSAW
jgi:hypothetical protein